MNEKHILKLIVPVVCIIIIIVICILIWLLNNGENETDIDAESELSDVEEDVEIEEEVQETKKVTDSLKFYMVTNCINKYVEKLNTDSTAYYGYDENDEYTKLVTDEEINEYVYELLSEDYIDENGITIANMQDNIEFFDQNVTFTPLEMNVYEQEITENYVVYGFLTDPTLNLIEEMYIGVNIDLDNNTFSIEPISSENITNIDEIEITNEDEGIEENDSNTIDTTTINNEYLCGQYLETYKKLILAMPELAYEYLDEEYKELRFGSYENFTEYITENYNNLYTLNLSEYDVELYDDYKEYVCVDNNGNTYIFTEADGIIMNFDAKLDIYTIETDTFVESYNALTDEEKVQTNINIFYQMINTKDYNAAYEILNDTFKTNNFATVDKFKEYAQNNFFDNTTITTVTDLTESGGYYVCTITTSSGSTSDAETSEETFIVSLGEGTDFEMSFTVKE